MMTYDRLRAHAHMPMPMASIDRKYRPIGIILLHHDSMERQKWKFERINRKSF